jgi:hypothetical protein
LAPLANQNAASTELRLQGAPPVPTKKPRTAAPATTPRIPQKSQAGKNAPNNSNDGAPTPEQPVNNAGAKNTAVKAVVLFCAGSFGSAKAYRLLEGPMFTVWIRKSSFLSWIDRIHALAKGRTESERTPGRRE